jgi:hypothetical protein
MSTPKVYRLRPTDLMLYFLLNPDKKSALTLLYWTYVLAAGIINAHSVN